MKNSITIRRTPHPAKEIFLKNNLMIGDVARFLKISYPYFSSILSGLQYPSKKIDKKIMDFAAQVEKKTATTSSSPARKGGDR